MSDNVDRVLYGNEGRPPLRDNRFMYAALGLITGPIGGWVAGFTLRDKEKELGAIKGTNENTVWTNPVTIVLGSLVFPVAGAFYGMELAKKEIEMDRIQLEKTNTAGRPQIQSDVDGHEKAPDISGTKWRNTVQEQRHAPAAQGLGA